MDDSERRERHAQRPISKIGIRQYYFDFDPPTTPHQPMGATGNTALLVEILRDSGTGFQPVCKLHGHEVAPLRAFLQRVEAEHPTLVGTDEHATSAPKTDIYRGESTPVPVGSETVN